MSKVLLLYNYSAGQRKSQGFLEQLCSVFEDSGASVTVRNIDFGANPFEGIDHADYVVVVGGDGTAGYVVSQMLRYGLDLPLGIIPAGTANDFALMLGIPSNPLQAAKHIVRSEVRAVDCGRVNDRYFINILSFGLFTTTSQRTLDRWKRILGRVAYVFEGLRELRDIRAIPLTIRTDDVQVSERVIMALIFNGRTAGRFPLARDAQPDDGLLDGVFLLESSFLRMTCDALRYLCGGKPSTIKHLRSRTFKIETECTDVATDIDGQQGPEFPLDVECLVSRLKIKS